MQRSAVIWFTGHSKAGKTTLSKVLADQLTRLGKQVVRLDSDTLPVSIIKPQAKSWEKRQELKLENLVFLAKLLYDRQTIVLISAVGRFRKWREALRKQIPDFIEIYLYCPLETRLERDVEAKYKRNKEYFYFYEEPLHPDLTINTDKQSIQESLNQILHHLEGNNYL